jgi:hypothetical protein
MSGVCEPDIMHISDEDLELFLIARLPAHQLSVVESHLSNCSSCTSRLSELAGLTFRIRMLSRRFGKYEGAERRGEHRIPADEPGQMQTFSPFSPTKVPIRIIDLSRNGLKVRTPQPVDPGSIVQVRIREAVVLGEVRYCVAAGAEFDAGIHIQDVFPMRRL